MHTPGSEDELASIVSSALLVKAKGSGHSWTSAACTDGEMISLERLNRILEVGPNEVEVEAGIRLWDLAHALAKHRLGLPVMGSIAEQTVAGAIATGTHGSGIGFGNLSSLVTRLRLVTAEGESLDLSEGDLFRAAKVGLGALGVVTRVRLRVEPAFNLHETATVLPLDAALELLPSAVKENEHTKLWWAPHTDTAWLFTANRTPDAERASREHLRRRSERIINPFVFRPLLAVGRLVPSAVPAIMRTVAKSYFEPYERVEWAPNVFTVAMPPRHLESEYALPVESAVEAQRQLRALIESGDHKVGFISELRFVKGDDAFMSPHSGRDSACLGAYTGLDPRRYLLAFERRALQMGGRPHWGKAFHYSVDDVKDSLPGHAQFMKARDTLDPTRKFDSPFLRGILEQ